MFISFEETLEECLKTPELLKEYRRLTGARLGNGSTIEMMIDKSTGYHDKEWKDFFDFVRDYIWMPVVTNQFSGMEKMI